MFDRHRPAAVLFDRDGVLIRGGDPRCVKPLPGARRALSRLRRADVPVGVVVNEPGLAEGWLTPDEMDRVNNRVEESMGPFDAWAICVHGVADGCTCRMPGPGLVIRAAAILDVSPRDCLLVGGSGEAMRTARAAGARGILVPSSPGSRPVLTLADEVAGSVEEVAERVLSEPVPAAAGIRGGGLAEWARAVGWNRW
ncbi:HAD-IIIA family hydrolase [Nonomuraea typhae]|uniref:HAD-IIIA family hydrolase n=1 Tax=Nonomuraea typhae TaxID=2603600 RepID=A0ABW7Z5Q9_9ACTN